MTSSHRIGAVIMYHEDYGVSALMEFAEEDVLTRVHVK